MSAAKQICNTKTKSDVRAFLVLTSSLQEIVAASLTGLVGKAFSELAHNRIDANQKLLVLKNPHFLISSK